MTRTLDPLIESRNSQFVGLRSISTERAVSLVQYGETGYSPFGQRVEVRCKFIPVAYRLLTRRPADFALGEG